MRSKYLKGSFTVEAAVILSLTVFILGALMIIVFYVHDRSILQCVTCEAVSAGSNFYKSDDRSKAAQKVKKQINMQRLLGSRGLKGYAATGEKEATASWSAVYPVPGFAVKYFSDGQLSINTSFSCKIHDPADMIRKIRGAEELITGGEH